MVLESGSWLEYKGRIFFSIYNTPPPPPPLYSENDDDENGGDNKINEE